MSRTATPSSPSSLPRVLLVVFALVLALTACAGGEDAPAEDDATESVEAGATDDGTDEEESPAPGDEDVPEASDAEEPTEADDQDGPDSDGPTEDSDSSAAADPALTAAVVAARDAALAAVPADWQTTPQEPEVGPTGVEQEESPLNDCLPPELADLESNVDALQAVSASGDFSAPETGEETFGPPSGSVSVNAYTDPTAAQDLLTQFGDAIADPGFSDCIVDATREEFGEPPPGSEFDIQVSAGVEGIDAEVALQILVNTSFGGEELMFDSYFVLASRGEFIIEGQFTGDGTNPFPTDIAAAVMDAAA